MTQAFPKRLIEVDLPIKRISEHARREKSIRHGHISTLHIWWARRPLAACRAVICAALWPDPADDRCPSAFVEAARREMTAWARDHATLASHESFQRFVAIQKNPHRLSDPKELRVALFDFIADFANWDNSTVPQYVRTSRALTQAAHEALGGAPNTKPLVVDPFAGGGAIPLEALRVGADTFASDLNPVAVLLNRVVLDYIPKHGSRLAQDVRKWGEWVKREAEKELARFYPKDPDGATPIAYLWARTIQCEGPGCGALVPLIRSFWLAKKKNRSVALHPVPNRKAKRVDFKIIVKGAEGWVDQANPETRLANPRFDGTIRGASATCPCCGFTTPKQRIREQLRVKRGGGYDARLFAVVTTHPSRVGRGYRLPTQGDTESVARATEALEHLQPTAEDGTLPLPDEPLPHEPVWKNNPIRVHLYGMERWRDLFSPRQQLALATLARIIRRVGAQVRMTESADAADAIQALLAMCLARLADRSATLCTWRPQADQEKVEHVFARQALPMTWDYAEGTFLSERTAGWNDAVEPPARVIESLGATIRTAGTVIQASATEHPLPSDSAQALISDPPYYDAVPYATLADFFYVWLKRAVPPAERASFSTELTPKEAECVVDEAKGKDRAFYERAMTKALTEGRRVLTPHGIGLLVFAHKSTEGWEAMLQAVIDAGWVITASWPIDTEMGTRLRAMNSAALASSVHLICRPRENANGWVQSDEVGDWRDVLAELPRRIHEWMPRLADEGVVGADAIFACLGPALEIFSRYSRVEKASGEVVALKEYLEQVWAAVAKEALMMIFAGADATGFEEDARLTAMWLWTLKTGEANGATDDDDDSEEESDDEKGTDKKNRAGGFVLEYDAARKIAQGLGAHLEDSDTLVEVTGQIARLVSVSERARALFGKDEGKAVPVRKKREPQLDLFKVLQDADDARVQFGDTKSPGKTVLDRVHQSMILFAAGRSEALKRFLTDDGAGRDQRFWQLAQALSALYPASSDEKRWVDGVMARKKALGL